MESGGIPSPNTRDLGYSDTAALRMTGRRYYLRMAEPVLAFTAVVEIRGINPFVVVSAAQVARIRPGWRRPLPVLVRLNNKPDTETAWRTNLMPAGDGSFYLYLNGPMRSATGVSVGSRVRVEFAFDASYRNGPLHPMPSWFSKALHKNAACRTNWAALPPSRKKEVLRYFAQLKSAEARARNLERAMDVLSGKRGRFMGRDWVDGA